MNVPHCSISIQQKQCAKEWTAKWMPLLMRKERTILISKFITKLVLSLFIFLFSFLWNSDNQEKPNEQTWYDQIFFLKHQMHHDCGLRLHQHHIVLQPNTFLTELLGIVFLCGYCRKKNMWNKTADKVASIFFCVHHESDMLQECIAKLCSDFGNHN